MTSDTEIDLEFLAREVDVPVSQAEQALDLLDEGNTVAFITRYRKDQTGGLDEEQIRLIQAVSGKLRQLNERKEAILKSIAAQSRLSPELRRLIEGTTSSKALEDLYLPYKPKKQTLATQARQRGLDPLSREIMEDHPAAIDLEQRAGDFVDPQKELPGVEQVLVGVRHILAEKFSEQAEVRVKLRPLLLKTGHVVSSRIEPAGKVLGDHPTSGGAASEVNPAAPSRPKKKTRKTAHNEASYRDYFEYREPISRVPPHRILAINRGEREKVLRVRIEGDSDQMFGVAAKVTVPREHRHVRFLRDCLRDALTRLTIPSLEREVRRELTERAEQHAVDVFARNLRKLLLQPPTRGRTILAIDPGFRSGCKLAVLDEFGNLLAHDLVYIVGKDELVQEGRARLAALIQKHELSLIAIGNGTGCRETESLVASLISGELAEREVSYVVVNEAGASVYSTSPIGREELPDFDPMIRSTVSIGRRLLDPLSELVKINPANIGVGMYQHDVKAKPLRESLDAVVESCVNFVGVDLNTASPSLLSYVSGLNQLTARRIFEHREVNGPFRNRAQLRDVPGIGEATHVQAAGFLRITDGDNPLDATWIHPESYDVAVRLLNKLDSSTAELSQGTPSGGTSARSLAKRASGIDVKSLAHELGVGEWLLKDLLAGLTRPGRDPRDDLPPPVFRSGIIKLDDLQPGMELRGTVLNVVDFGAFVDIGLSDSALIHISRLANRYILDPHEVVSVGDVMTVWVVSIDKVRRRVSLSAVPPDGETQVSQQLPPSNQAKIRHSKHPKQQRSAKQKSSRSPAPLTTISDEMVQGKEPLRSFADLAQYYQQKKADDGSSNE